MERISRAAVYIAAGALALWLVALAAVIGLARVLPSEGDFAYDAPSTNGTAIFRYDIRTGLSVRVTDGNALDFSPVWSPDGQRIAFVSTRDGGNELYLMDASGANMRQLTNDIATINNPAWSPDGRYIAFEAFQDNAQGIYIFDTTTETLTRIMFTGSGYSRGPRWSPDSRALALVGSSRSDSELFLANIETGSIEQLTDNSSSDWSPEWSPDGRWLVYFSNHDSNMDLYALEVATGAITRLTYHLSYEAIPLWSPDGRYVLFASDRSGKPGYYVMEMGCIERNDCSDAVWLLNDELEFESGTWSPDSRRIALIRRAGDVYLLDIGCALNGDRCDVENTYTYGRGIAWRPE